MTNSSRLTRIAIADDDPESLEILREALLSPTVEIAEAAGGGQLVELLAEQGPFDLIVTDVDMPWMDGISALRSARAAKITTPVLVITGLARTGLQVAVARLGGAKLLRKPIDIHAVRNAVAELLGGVA
jgi:two-component system response regulator (stage 0 sporulation protein F)